MLAKINFTFFILHLPAYCDAFWWARPDVSSIPTLAFESRPLETLSNNEVDAILSSHASLEKYSHRPDCFLRATTFIKERCNELDFHEGERINAAIMMTLCEISTAKHHSMPLECLHFSPVHLGKHTLEGQGECVDAFSRSAQFWSSYSGYLREVSQLCFAFRRWNDIDMAKEIYQNITFEKLSFIRLLFAREQSFASEMHKFGSHLMDIHGVSSKLQSTSEILDKASKDVLDGINDDMRKIATNFESNLSVSLSKQNDATAKALAQIENILNTAFRLYETELTITLPQIQNRFAHELQTVMEYALVQHRQSLEIANIAQSKWNEFANNFDGLKDDVGSLTDIAVRTAASLDESVQQAGVLKQSQLEASISAGVLVKTLDELVSLTHTGLLQINDSVTLINQSLVLEDKPNDWIITSAIRIMEIMLQGHFEKNSFQEGTALKFLPN